jgi:hypothetical protein
MGHHFAMSPRRNWRLAFVREVIEQALSLPGRSSVQVCPLVQALSTTQVRLSGT